MKKHTHKNMAFTLIELLVVMVIIGILATVSVATFGGNKEKAQMAKQTANCVQRQKCEQAEAICEENGGINCDSFCEGDVLNCDDTLYNEFIAAQGGGGESSQGGSSYPPASQWTADSCFTNFSSGTIVWPNGYDSNCGLDVIIPENIGGVPVTTIASYAFQFVGLDSIRIPDTVTTIGNNAFHGNDFTEITLPENLVSIGNYAFAGHNISTEIYIPDLVTSIGQGAFQGNVTVTGVSAPSVSWADYLVPWIHTFGSCTAASGCATIRN